MPENPYSIAVHYFYLLKEDGEDQQRLWTLLAGSPLKPAGPSLSLGLTQSVAETSSQCRIVHRSDGPSEDYCLILLPDLTLIEAIHKSSDGAPLAQQWQEALQRIEENRSRVAAENINVIGETTFLLAPGSSSADLASEAAALIPGKMLLSSLSPETRTTGALAHVTGHGEPGRDYYFLAAIDCESCLATTFPQMDSLIKKLKRETSHFREQRQAIVKQRAEIDNQVGALLHQQVISGGSTETSAAQLEERIANLSRMFGLLATDSLLVRQAGDLLEKDTRLLGESLSAMLDRDPHNPDDIGEYYMEVFDADLGEVAAEADHLDFSRQNAQAAIEVVRTQVELLRAGEEAAIQEQTRQLLSRSLILQKERLSLQVAAAFVEFVLVFYYVLKSWEGILGQEAVEHITPGVRALLVGSFSASAAVGTHFLAQCLQTRRWNNRGLWVSVAVLVLSTLAMVMLTISQN